MPGPRWLLSLETAFTKRIGRGGTCQAPVNFPPGSPQIIIGRETVLARLRGLVDPVPQAGQVLLVTGEAGMGRRCC